MKPKLSSQELGLRDCHTEVSIGFENLEFVNVGLVVLFEEIKVFVLPRVNPCPPNTRKSNV